VAKKRRKGDPHRHIDRLAAGQGGGEDRRARERDAATRAAAVPTTAARWLVLAPEDHDAPVVAVDVLAELLALDARTTLRSREGDRLRTLAGHVEGLVGAGAVCPSGALLLDLLVTDDEARAALEPSIDLAALLSDEGPTRSTMDRTIRFADAMVARAAAHRAGEVDLAAAAAPSLPLHTSAAEVGAIVGVATEGRALPANPAPAIAEVEAGWLPASPYELFLAAASGLLVGGTIDVVGEALARWFDGWVRGPDPWRQALLDRVPVDADGLLRDAATRAGSDHPTVIASVVVDLVANRHPLG
jgi:hypothetical protein